MSEQPGRYQRSFAGLIGSIIVCLLVIGAFVAFRATFRDEVEQRPEAVDYRVAVAAAQDAGFEVAYPAALPEGWIVTSIAPEVAAGEWGLGMLTDDEAFVGVRQEDADLDDLLTTYVEENRGEIASEGDQEIDSEIASTWSVWTDEGGDRAYAAEVGDQVVLVYGSAPEDDLVATVESLTTQPLRP